MVVAVVGKGEDERGWKGLDDVWRRGDLDESNV